MKITKNELRTIIKEELQKLNEAPMDVFVLWANGVSDNLSKAIKKAKYIGKSGKWNDAYKTNASNGHGTVFFVPAENVAQAKQIIQKATDKNRIGRNIYAKFGQSISDGVITEATVTRIPNFNLESDAYIAMLDIMNKNRPIFNEFRKVAIKHATEVYTGGKYQLSAVIKDLTPIFKPKTGFLKQVVNKINERVLRIHVPDRDMERIIPKFAGVLALGLYDSLTGDPIDFDLVKKLGPSVSRLANNYSVNRGKSKLKTIMGTSKLK